VKHLSTNLWQHYQESQHQERLSHLLKKRIDQLVKDKNSDELSAFVENYAHMLKPSDLLAYRQTNLDVWSP
jgi:hypothetical protein